MTKGGEVTHADRASRSAQRGEHGLVSLGTCPLDLQNLHSEPRDPDMMLRSEGSHVTCHLTHSFMRRVSVRRRHPKHLNILDASHALNMKQTDAPKYY